MALIEDLETYTSCAPLFVQLELLTRAGADTGIAGAAHVAKLVGGIRTALTAFVDAFKHIVEEEGYADRCCDHGQALLLLLTDVVFAAGPSHRCGDCKTACRSW